jgi:hypothetical protein
MTESDELLSKADALLGRSRRGAAAPQPPADYPVLTEIVTAPDSPAWTAGPMDAPAADSLGEARPDTPSVPVTAGATIAALDTGDELPHLLPLEQAPAAGADTDTAALEERVRRRVIEAIEPYIRAFLEEPLRLRIEQLVRDLSKNIARDARNDILSLVRDAVQSAVARELEARRDERSDRR